jgi:cysteine desulfurase/selenocysteine lyase
MTDYPDGLFFSDEMQAQIKDKFYYINDDPHIGERLFFDNAGGSLRLKSAVSKYTEIDAIPDCSERVHKMALSLQEIQNEGTNDIRIIFNAYDGSIITSLTASQVMFEIVRTVAENIPGTNMVTTVLEHPSAFDSMQFYANKMHRELRVASSNNKTGGVDVDSIVKLIDRDTVLLSCIYASNITGAILEVKEIVHCAREVKPDLYIICDAVQHAPHGVIDVQKVPVDGINIAPYKFFGNRGSGIGYVSPRLAKLPHHKLIAKPESEWELGSPAPSQFRAITEIVNYVTWIGSMYLESDDRRTLFVEGMDRIKLHERALMSVLLNGINNKIGLRAMKNIRVHFDHKDLKTRDFIMAISFDNIGFTQAVREYEKRNIIVYDRVVTSLYSKRILESFGLQGVIRLSPLHCNNISDIQRFLEVTEELTKL